MNVEEISVRAKAYGMPGRELDGNDALEVYTAVLEAKDYVKKNGPVLLVANTYRVMGHCKSDANRYRSRDEITLWKERCPIKRMRSYLEEKGTLPSQELNVMETKAKEDIERAVEFAQSCPYPSLDTISDDVYG